MLKKLFVGRFFDLINEGDFLDYFSKFGEVIDVYILKLMRGILFVIFVLGEVVKKVQFQNYRLGLNLFNVNFVEFKVVKNVYMFFLVDIQFMF